ncbi:MAG: tetratricopeptide repeat protein [Deltaproteobacteria bacterium]|nr:tetratricopeptide repeat protein [Deltaproteobacteria bacterium]
MDDRFKQQLAQAREHYLRQEYAEAEPLLRALLARSQDHADVHNMLGVVHHQRGEFDDARRCFEAALTQNPRYSEAALNLAVTCNELGRYSEARKVYSTLTERTRSEQRLDRFTRGKLANLHAQVAHAYASVEHYPNAAEEYRRALELCPDFGDLRTRLGQVLRELGDHNGAVREFRQAIAQDSRYVPAYIALGVAHFAAGERAEAEKAWQGALAQDPDNRSAQCYLRTLKALATPSVLPPEDQDAPSDDFVVSLAEEAAPSEAPHST